jgi:hypothetical protein
MAKPTYFFQTYNFPSAEPHEFVSFLHLESLWFGKPCLASNASSIPEVGGKYATYFNPQSIEDIKDNIRAFLDKADKNTPPDRIALRTWRKVNDELMACLTTPLQIFAHTDTEAQ